ncbi:MAG: cell division protein SepF [Lachnospiraceae bacterium]
MGKVTDKLLNFMKLNDEEEYDDSFFEGEEEEEEEESEVTQEENVTEKESNKMKNFFARRIDEKQVQDNEEEEEETPIRESMRKTNITSYRTNRDVPSADNRGGDMVKVVRAQEFEEVRAMIDLLKENKIVVINLEGLNVDVAQRIIDCISGSSYALDGKLEGVNDNIFILAPKDVEITGDLKNKVKNGSIAPRIDRY